MMKIAWILLVCLIVNSISLAPAIAEQLSDREKAGLTGHVRTMIERSGNLDNGSALFSVTRTYDVQGRLSEMESVLSIPGDSHTELKRRTVYISQGNMKKYGTSYKDGTVTSTSVSICDVDGRPTEFSIYNPEGVITFKTVQRYDDGGNKTETIIYKYGGTIAFRELWTYHTDANGKAENVISYRSDGSVDYKATTKYDNNGHKLEQVVFRADAITDKRTTYIYNEKGQEKEEVNYNSEGSILTRAVSAYEYDSIGNWTKKTTQRLVIKDGKWIPESTEFVERVISYY